MKLRIANPQKFVSRIGFLMIIVVLLSGYGLNHVLTKHELKINTDSVMMVTVKPGDTVWTIAQTTNPVSDDVRFLVHDIIRLNGLDANGTINPGQRIMLPVRGGDMLADN